MSQKSDVNAIQFLDADQYAGGFTDKISFRMIVLEHLRKIISLSCCEWTGGYWNEKIKMAKNIGFTEKVYIPDSREIYVNAVNSLYDILYPHFDQEMIDDDKKINEFKKTFILNYLVDQNGKREWKSTTAREEYKTDIISEIQRPLFRALNCFLKRQDYMKGKVFEDVA